MPIFLLAAAAMLLFTACTFPPPCADGACVEGGVDPVIMDAAQRVHDFYGTQQPLPKIVVYLQGNCPANVPVPTGSRAIPNGKILLANGDCDYGAYYIDTNTIYLLNMDWGTPNWDWRDILAHELLHQYLYERYGGDGDYNHTREEWDTLYPAAVALLKG